MPGCTAGLFPAGAFGTVVCNPPYRAVGNGRLNPNLEKAMARHELTLTLAQLVQACQHLLTRRGLLAMVHHPSRLAELSARLEAAHLRPRRLRLVHATPQAEASIVLVEAVQGSRGGLTVLPPLFVYVARGRYTGRDCRRSLAECSMAEPGSHTRGGVEPGTLYVVATPISNLEALPCVPCVCWVVSTSSLQERHPAYP